jgi:LacI family transcriptional regulator
MRLHSAQSRLAAFTKSTQECGITQDLTRIVEGDHTLEGGVKAMEILLAQKETATAVICSNDMTAIGVLHKLYRTGLRVPDDISVIGFDDIHLAEVTMPPLTTVQMSRFEIAKAAFSALRAHVESPNESAGKREYCIPTELVVRESTGAPRGIKTRLRKPARS